MSAYMRVEQVGSIVDDSAIGFKNPQRGRVYGTDALSPAIYCFGGGNLQPKIIEMEKITNLGRCSNSQNGAVVGADGLSPCLMSGGSGHDSTIPKVMEKKQQFKLPPELEGRKFRIRKLTPRECFRLMGVDDADIDKIQAAGISNSGQYRLAGNSIVVDTLFNLFRKLLVETGPDKTDKPQQLTLF